MLILLRAQQWIHQNDQQLKVNRNPGNLRYKGYTKVTLKETLKIQWKYTPENWI